MNSVIFFPHEKIEDDIYCTEDSDRTQHVHSHIKKHVGDEIKINLIDIGIAKAEVIEISKKKLLVKKVSEPILTPLKEHSLIIGLSRPQSIKKILEYGSCFGVKKFLFFEASLSEKSYGGAKIFAKSEYQKNLLNGLSQSCRYSNLPEVQVIKDIPWSDLPKNRFLLSLNAHKRCMDLAEKDVINSCFAIGPERGWTEAEEEMFLKQGFNGLYISTSILRTEVATMAILSQIEMLCLKVTFNSNF